MAEKSEILLSVIYPESMLGPDRSNHVVTPQRFGGTPSKETPYGYCDEIRMVRVIWQFDKQSLAERALRETQKFLENWKDNHGGQPFGLELIIQMKIEGRIGKPSIDQPNA